MYLDLGNKFVFSDYSIDERTINDSLQLGDHQEAKGGIGALNNPKANDINEGIAYCAADTMRTLEPQ